MTFPIQKQFQEIPKNRKIVGKPLYFLINLEIAPTFLNLAPKLYHNQFLV
jgi:hypothetical protein